jgi:hypothetical protein
MSAIVHRQRSALSESASLLSVWSTRQSLENTRRRLCRVLHSAKKARRTVHRQRLLCRVLFIGHSAKMFVKCRKVLGKEKLLSRWLVTATEPLPNVRRTSTRQKDRQRAPLPVALPSALGDTRQRLLLCRAPRPQHSAKRLYRCPCVPSLLSAMTWTLGKIPLCRVLHSAKWPVYPFFICFCYSIQTNKRYHIIITDITYLTKTINQTSSHKALSTCSNTNISIQHWRT